MIHCMSEQRKVQCQNKDVCNQNIQGERKEKAFTEVVDTKFSKFKKKILKADRSGV